MMSSMPSSMGSWGPNWGDGWEGWEGYDYDEGPGSGVAFFFFSGFRPIDIWLVYTHMYIYI